MSEFAKRITLLRKRKSLTQAEAACLVGRSLTAYKLWESGKNEPNISNIICLANYYGVTIDWLLGRDFTDKGNPTIDDIVAYQVRHEISKAISQLKVMLTDDCKEVTPNA